MVSLAAPPFCVPETVTLNVTGAEELPDARLELEYPVGMVMTPLELIAQFASVRNPLAERVASVVDLAPSENDLLVRPASSVIATVTFSVSPMIASADVVDMDTTL